MSMSADPSAHRLLQSARPARLDAVLLVKVGVAVSRKSGCRLTPVGSQRLIERGNCRWELPQNLVHQSRRNPHHGRACTSRGGCGTHRVDKQSRLADDGTGLGNENGRPVTSIERNRALYHNKTTVRGIALAEEDVALLQS